MAGELTYLESDGKSIHVPLLYEVDAGQIAVVKGWVGIVEAGGVSGDTVALNIDQREYQFTVPASLNVAWGDTVYITIATLTGHIPDDAAYTKTAGAGKVALFKATGDENSDNIVTGILLPNVLS
jgi:plastocyanin